MNRFRTISFMMAFMAILVGDEVRAESQNGIYVGVLAGAGIVGGLTTFDYGLTAGLKVGTHLGFGLYFTNMGLGAPSGILLGYSASSSLMSILGEANYFLLDGEKLHVGVKLGFVFNSASLT